MSAASGRCSDHFRSATPIVGTFLYGVAGIKDRAAVGARDKGPWRAKLPNNGTAFAFKRQGGDTLLLTNDHVAAWPQVTDHQHAVPGVGPGCKKISESLSLVGEEHVAAVGGELSPCWRAHITAMT
jgi:hypothetical protein